MRDPRGRLGAAGFGGLKAHPFFAGAGQPEPEPVPERKAAPEAQPQQPQSGQPVEPQLTGAAAGAAAGAGGFEAVRCRAPPTLVAAPEEPAAGDDGDDWGLPYDRSVG